MRSLKQLQKQAKKLKIRITKKIKNNNKRLYKTHIQLSKEIKIKKNKIKNQKFGVKIRFSDDTKTSANHTLVRPKEKTCNTKRKERVQILLNDPLLRRTEALKEKKISEIIAKLININESENHDTLHLEIMIDVLRHYKRHYNNTLRAFEFLKNEYIKKFPDKIPEVIGVFNYLKRFIYEIIIIRNITVQKSTKT